MSLKVLGMSTGGLHQARIAGHGPRYLRLGKLIRYLRVDVIQYLEDNRFDPVPRGVSLPPKPGPLAGDATATGRTLRW